MLFGLNLNASFLLFDPIGKLVENFLRERQLFVFKELSHLIVYEITSVTESSLRCLVVTTIPKVNI